MTRVEEKKPAHAQHRGRPRRLANRQVVDQLMAATEELLRHRSHIDVTEREIATAAGVTQAMIHYYFQDKDGLLFEVFARHNDEIQTKLKSLHAIHPKSKNLHRQIFRILFNAYFAKPWILKIITAEAMREGSMVTEFFKNKYGSERPVLEHLHKLIKRLIDAGVYNNQVNVRHLAIHIFSIIAGPTMLVNVSDASGSLFEQCKNEDWIDYLASLFDRNLVVKPSSSGSTSR